MHKVIIVQAGWCRTLIYLAILLRTFNSIVCEMLIELPFFLVRLHKDSVHAECLQIKHNIISHNSKRKHQLNSRLQFMRHNSHKHLMDQIKYVNICKINSIKMQVMHSIKSRFLSFSRSFCRIWHNTISPFMCRQAQIKA